MTNGTVQQWEHNFGTVNAYASGGSDTAIMYDSSGNDVFVTGLMSLNEQANASNQSTSSFAQMNSPGGTPTIVQTAYGFKYSYGYSVNGGTDEASQFDGSAAGNLYVVALSGSSGPYADMETATGSVQQIATNFAQNYGAALTGQHDQATFYSAATGTSTLALTSTTVTATVTGHFYEAYADGGVGYWQVNAIGTTGTGSRNNPGSTTYTYVGQGFWA